MKSLLSVLTIGISHLYWRNLSLSDLNGHDKEYQPHACFDWLVEWIILVGGEWVPNGEFKAANPINDTGISQCVYSHRGLNLFFHNVT